MEGKKEGFLQNMVNNAKTAHEENKKKIQDKVSQIQEKVSSDLHSASKAFKYPDFRRFVEEMGYALEKHIYETEDGYINTVFRIPGKETTIGKSNLPKKPVVIYQHGLIDSCAGILCLKSKSLGIMLVDAGYDLWLNNSRGNRFSRDHMALDVEKSKEEYFSFSFQEMGQFDQPALWTYIMQKTGVEKITYIGHSQGTSQMFAALSENHQFFKDKLNLYIAIAPVVKLKFFGSKFIREQSKTVVWKAIKALGPEQFTTATGSNPLQGIAASSALGNFTSG
jgi:pimeloyl-ACP methyl ester carboxylesterase